MKTINFLVGDSRTKTHVTLLQSLGWGRMLNVGLVTPYQNEPLGFDNHAWADHCNKQPFNAKKFESRIKKAQHLTDHFIVAVTPDRVMGGNKSLELSNAWIGKLSKDNGFPWFLAVQDGMDIAKVENSLTTYPYRGIFLGGGDSFKNYEAKKYSLLAKKYGLKFHYGRCGTKSKLRHANAIKADSADSVIPLYSKERVNGLIRELNFQNSNRAASVNLCSSFDSKLMEQERKELEDRS